MNLKRILFLIFFIVISFLFFVAMFFLNNEDADMGSNLYVNKCDPFLSIVESSKSGNFEHCECLESVEEKNICIGKTKNIVNYDRGIKNADSFFCDQIDDLNMKNACINIIEGKNVYSQVQDSERTENLNEDY